MPIPTREELKAFLETGDTPTESEFHEIIDAIYDLNQEATQIAVQAAGRSAKCFAKLRAEFRDLSGSPFYENTFTSLNEAGCTIAGVLAISNPTPFHWDFTITLTPTADFLTTDYMVIMLPLRNLTFVSGMVTYTATFVSQEITSKATNEIEFLVKYTSPHASTLPDFFELEFEVVVFEAPAP